MTTPYKLTAPDHLQNYARKNRKNPTLAEQKLWQLLRGSRLNGLKFRRQATIAPYIVDFACLAHMLIIELDGQSHDNQGTRDLKRQQFLESQGYKVLRFANDDVLHHPEIVLEAILKFAFSPKGKDVTSPRVTGEIPPPSSPEGENVTSEASDR